MSLLGAQSVKDPDLHYQHTMSQTALTNVACATFSSLRLFNQ